METNALPVIEMNAFFALPEVKACQAIQQCNPYRSPAHRQAHEKLVALASEYTDAKGKSCASYFGGY